MMIDDKTHLRHHFTRIRKTIPKNSRVFDRLITNRQVLTASTICVYVSFHEEVDTHQFINWCLLHHKRVCIPKVVGDNLFLYQISSLTDCIPGYKGILEPPSSAQLIDPKLIDTFVVLGLAFDVRGFRLGYGKGFTDRLLRPLKKYSIGICYSDQLVYELPHTDYDVPVNEVVFDEGAILCPPYQLPTLPSIKLSNPKNIANSKV